MKNTIFLKTLLSASMVMGTAGMAVQPSMIFAQEEPADFDSETALLEQYLLEEGMDPTPFRNGTDVKCSLTIDTKADGVVTSTLLYQPGKEMTQIQIGGDLNMKNVWNNYVTFRTMYTLTHSKEEFYTKSLTGSYAYTFQVNPDIVSVNEDILCSTDAWQEVFAESNKENGAGFFKFMKCTEASYDAATGVVTVRFTIDENGTGKVSTRTLENDKTTRPASIHSYSPEGAFFIKNKDFKKGGQAVLETATFKGQIDLDPWMALVFPVRFEGVIVQTGMNLDVPAGTVAFNIENGTWSDGTTDTKTVLIDMDMVNKDGQSFAAGTLLNDHIPCGMKAAEGFDQASGKWTTELNLDENGTVLAPEGELSASYTYSFDKIEEPGDDDNDNDNDNDVDNGGGDDTIKPDKVVELHRLYNPNSGEHLFTIDVREKDFLDANGWDYEGVSWTAPEIFDLPVYRVYNPNNGDHHYTLDEREAAVLTSIGWEYEGIAWYSNAHGQGTPVYRTYNPNANQAGSHHFTQSRKETEHLISKGWLGEGIAWWSAE